MERSLETTVAQAVDAWLRWLPRWRPATTRGRTRLCRRCFGSPVIAAAGLDTDVPHAVQHGLSTRMKTIVDAVVDEYTERNLPLLHTELADAERRKAEGYRPDQGLDPEFDGLPLDPEPEPGEPYLFTFAELAGASESGRTPPPRDLSDEEKQALRTELRLADECASHAGRLVCIALEEHRGRIADGVRRYVEPQVEALLSDLTLNLDTPPSRWS
jgi:hypothetical protein